MIYTKQAIKLFEDFSIFIVFEFFLHTQKQKHKSKIKNNAYEEMHDAQMHDNEASNA